MIFHLSARRHHTQKGNIPSYTGEFDQPARRAGSQAQNEYILYLNEKVQDRVREKLTDKVNEYRKGKKGLLALFVGEVMKQTKGKADPRVTNELLLKKLKP